MDELGQSENVVATLLEGYLVKGHTCTIYVDNWYSSTACFTLLHDWDTNACSQCEKHS